ncbi:MAG TPA: hypothetical protein VGR00_12665 [Thermoanaerobaculia bacterium]|nr:hypothetical protein [Thermoanaerobaculia bacterium]
MVESRSRVALSTRSVALFSLAAVGLLAAAALFAASCGVGSRHHPTDASCADIGGSYDGTFTNSCGGSGHGVVIVTQAGCTFNALIPGFGGGSIAGHVDDRTATFTLYFSTPCGGSATGTATISSSGRRIDGTYSGGATGGNGCCNPVSGSFTLTQ